MPVARPTRTKATFWAFVVVAGGALAAVLIVISARRDESDSSSGRVAPVHVHGLGVNPADRALYIATHTGMWRLSPGAAEPTPVGESRQDTMGFTIVGPDHFLGSGHPDNLDEPSLLGLIESFDRGGTWKPISLTGEADFHVLRANGRRVYGYDVSRRRLLVSANGGETWVERSPPAAVLDFVVGPAAPNRLVAATSAGLLASADTGTTWQRVATALGLLSWPSRGRLYLAAEGGDVFVSRDAGGTWKRVGTLGGQPAAFLARTARELFAALHDGTILRSEDNGRNWRTITRGYSDGLAK